MRKFRFQFETVLKVRKSREQEFLSALGAAQGAYQSALAHKQALVTLLHAGLARREELGQAIASPFDYRLEQEYIDGNKHRIMRADQAIVRASRAVEKALRAYLGARRQTRMIEVLEERAYATFRRELTRRERKSTDELVVLRARLASDSPLSILDAPEGVVDPALLVEETA